MSSHTPCPKTQSSNPESDLDVITSTEPSSTVTLGEDILLLIFELLPKSSLRVLLQVNRVFRNLALPLLYHTVDFSLKPVIDVHHVVARSWRPTSSIQVLLIRQWLFAQQIVRTPFYGTLVRSFAWTLGFNGRWPLPLAMNRRYDDEVIHTMFGHLTFATHINIDTGEDQHDFVPYLPALFPSATHIHFGGKTSYAFASSVLHSHTSTALHSLTIENVIDGGLIQDSASRQSMPVTKSRRNDMERLLELPEIWPPYSFPLQIRPSCMRHLLNPNLVHRCRGLRYLTLLKQGHQHPQQLFPSATTFDEDLYKEWASFISAVKPSVLIIGHLKDIRKPFNGVPIGRTCMLPRPEHLIWPEIAPMDEYVRVNLMPVLRQGWPGLEKLEIRGVSRRVLGILEAEKGLNGVEVIVREGLDWAWNATVGH